MSTGVSFGVSAGVNPDFDVVVGAGGNGDMHFSWSVLLGVFCTWIGV